MVEIAYKISRLAACGAIVALITSLTACETVTDESGNQYSVTADNGTFKGTKVQSDGKSFPMELRGVNPTKVDYPTLGCSGRLELVSRTMNEVIFREKIERGSCDDGGTFSSTMSGKNVVNLRWSKEGSDITANATLARNRTQADNSNSSLLTAYNPMLSDKEVFWRGVGLEKGNNNWPVTVRLGGRVVGVGYPTLQCWGKWYKIAESSSHAMYKEILESQDGKCDEEGYIVLNLQKSGKIVAFWRRNISDKSSRAFALLEVGKLDEAKDEKLRSLSMNEVKWRTQKSVVYEAPKPIENNMLASAETKLSKQQKAKSPQSQNPQMTGDVAAAHLLGGLIGFVYGDAFRASSQGEISTAPSVSQTSEPVTQTMKGKPIADPRGGSCSVDGDRRVYCNGKEIGQASRAPLGGVRDLCVKSEYGDSRLMDNNDEAIQSILRRCRR